MPHFDDQTIYQLFGTEDAENEQPDRLKQYFFKNKAYESLKADLPIRILVGHKGVGKSALLKICHLEDKTDGIVSLWIRPNDVFGEVDSQTDDFLKLIQNWKRGISQLIVRKTFENAELFEEASIQRRIEGGAREVFSILASRFMKADGDLTESATAVSRAFSNSQTIRIYLDDLDRGWQARPKDILNISALLNCIRDMAGQDRRIQFRIGLRTDVYHLVRTSDESTDKIESNLIWLIWSNHEILTAMAKRVASYFRMRFDEEKIISYRQADIAQFLNKVIEPTFQDRGKWENERMHRILMTLTRKRPRDLIKLFIYSSKEAFKDGAEIIRTAHLKRIFEKYSNERIRDTANEFKSELPEIENVLLGMRQTRSEREKRIGPVYEEGQLFTKLKSIIEQTNPRFTNGTAVTPKNLARFLYKCDFITARFEHDNYIVRKHFDENQLLASERATFGFKWEIHPAYRWALDPHDTRLTTQSIPLTHDESDKIWESTIK